MTDAAPPSDRPASDAPAGGAAFPPTLWSVVLSAGRQSDRSQEALATLCRAYWYPLYAYLRRKGMDPEDAEDSTQSFFVHLLEKNRLETVCPQKGRFRSFLLTALQHFVVDEWKKARAQKRGGGVSVISLDPAAAEGRYQAEPAVGVDPEKLYELRWALSIMERVMAQLETEQKNAGRLPRFESLKVFLSGDAPELTYADAGRPLGMSEGAVKVAVLRLRQRYRELIRAEIAQTVSSEHEIDEELRHLLTILSR